MTTIEEAPQAEKTPHGAITGVMKAAILLVTLGEQASAAVVKQLTDDEVRKVTRAIADIRIISPQQAEQVLDEFYQATTAREFPHQGGADYARRVLTTAFGREGGRLVNELALDELGAEHAAEPLRRTAPQHLSLLIRDEHPQTVAIVLAHLNQAQGAALLASLPKESRADIAIRMAALDQISPGVIKKISSVLTQRIQSLGEVKREAIGGVRFVAEVLNRMEGGASDEILDDIRDRQEALEQGIRHYMFVFEDLLRIDSKGIKEVVAKVDRKLLVLALKGTSDELKNHLLGCMSQRGAEMVREDMEAMGPVKIRDVEAAQQQIIAAVRMLEKEGVVSLAAGEESQYVL